MNNTNLQFAPLDGTPSMPTAHEKFTGLDRVAQPGGDSANTLMFAPSFPNHGHQPARLLAALMRNDELTHRSAWEKLGMSRLAAVAGELGKKYGWNVICIKRSVVNRFGETSKIGFYTLASTDVTWAGERGARFADIEYGQMASLANKAKQKRGAC